MIKHKVKHDIQQDVVVYREDKTINIKFKNLTDFYNSIDVKKLDAKKAKTYDALDSILEASKDWHGVDAKDIDNFKYKNPPAKKLLDEMELPNIENTGTYTKKTVWSEDSGIEYDHDRYNNEQPFLKNVKKVAGSRGQRGFKKIFVSIGEGARVTPEMILYKTVGIGRLVDQLEYNNTSTEIILVFRSKQSTKSGRGFNITIPIKKYEDNLNISLLLAVFSPYFLRCFMLGFIAYYFPCTIGRGKVLSILPDYTEQNTDNIYVDSGTLITKNRMINFLKQWSN